MKLATYKRLDAQLGEAISRGVWLNRQFRTSDKKAKEILTAECHKNRSNMEAIRRRMKFKVVGT